MIYALRVGYDPAVWPWPLNSGLKHRLKGQAGNDITLCPSACTTETFFCLTIWRTTRNCWSSTVISHINEQRHHWETLLISKCYSVKKKLEMLKPFSCLSPPNAPHPQFPVQTAGNVPGLFFLRKPTYAWNIQKRWTCISLWWYKGSLLWTGQKMSTCRIITERQNNSYKPQI